MQRLHCIQILLERHEVGLLALLTKITSTGASGISYDVLFAADGFMPVSCPPGT
jgi:hypothetical protein